MIAAVITTGLVFSCETDDLSVIEGLPDSVVNNDPPGSPPRGLTEAANGHTEAVTRQYFDADAAIYYDPEVDREIIWPFNYFSEAWNYVKETYGGFGNENLLYVIAHGEETAPFTRTIFDEDAAGRSILDIAVTESEPSAAKRDQIAFLMSTIVENSSNRVHLSPAAAVWQDKFSEIFTYDLYMGMGSEQDAERVAGVYNERSANYPSENVFWFRDWFFPIYDTYGGSITLANFLNILSKNYPIDGTAYAGEMNMGQMVHFFSGATGEDLQLLAEQAFGWNDEWAFQLLQARAQFPNLSYPFEPASQIVDLTVDATLSVSKDNDSGPDAGEGSLKLIDNDETTKFLASGFPQEFWVQQNFDAAVVANRYTITSGNDAPDRDMKNWELLGSNDGSNWEVLDTRTDQLFADRIFTREFNFDNDQAYQFYRINVLANNGSSLIQMGEWRMLRLELLDFGPTDFTTNATITVSRENNDGAGGAEGSLKVIDDNIDTKFLVGGFPEAFWMQQNFTDGVVVNQYTFTSGNDAAERDPVDWTLSGSNDELTWDLLDTRTEQSFPDRKYTSNFHVSNDQAYRYYRIEITKNNGSDAMQLSEWRLLGGNN